MESIDHIYYINLDYRIDRKEQFENEMKSFAIDPEKCERISAIHVPEFGILGCGLSHKKTIETFLASPYKNCIIFEDDFQFIQDQTTINELINKVFTNVKEFDVLMLSANILNGQPTEHYFLTKVK